MSLSPRATRFVMALGATERLVGVDTESARIAGLEMLPSTDLANASDLSPDLVLVAEGAGSPFDPSHLEVAPHDLEDVFDLYRTLGTRLVGEARARSLETALARPLAEIGGSSFGRERPRVLALVSSEPPLQLAGGHSFETDLIEIAGARSLTHGGDETRIELSPDDWAAYAPDLVLVMTPAPATQAQRRRLREAVPPGLPVTFFVVPEDFWLGDATEPAKRLRAEITAFHRQRETRSPPSSPP